MTEPAFFALTALVAGPLHGYALLTEVEELSGGRVSMKVGTLYGLLDRLTAEAFIELDREELHQGRTRRYHRLTGPGREALQAEVERQAANARAASRRLAAHSALPAPGRPKAAGSGAAGAVGA
ncbi:hypothetical protein GCM10023225_15880 [Kineococcus glutinatus]|uniref:Transcription regulator PadR N-terminal domain-containing protein n=2 Tax=Kineococcus glutinatus TaxID=1070872 RepID=A0ABP9HPS6_9ACTN